ncbi:hypothetical protein DEDE109153_05400 [Deinococcus deserti]
MGARKQGRWYLHSTRCQTKSTRLSASNGLAKRLHFYCYPAPVSWGSNHLYPDSRRPVPALSV